MKLSIKPLSLVICLLFFFVSASNAQKKISRTVHARTVDASRGQENPNIRSEAPVTDEPEMPARGAGSCSIKFANYTGYYVNVYVDGYYRGQVAPWGGGTVVTGSGYTSIYCITAGKTLEWLDTGNCTVLYTFKLYP